MAKKSGKNKKNLIIGICAAIVVIAVIVVAIVMATKNNGGLSDDYFKSDDTKYVLTLEADQMSVTEEEHIPVKAHLVYTYSGEEITSLKAYYEYADIAAATAAYNYFIDNQDGEYKSIVLEGKYVVLEADKSQYEDLTTSDVKQQIEYLEVLKSMESESNESEDENYVEAVEDTVEEIQE